jgi:predicted ArsR family transcriptional regulator
MLHLKHLEKDALLTKEEILQSKVGRPKILYKPAAKRLDTVQTKSDYIREYPD